MISARWFSKEGWRNESTKHSVRSTYNGDRDFRAKKAGAEFRGHMQEDGMQQEMRGARASSSGDALPAKCAIIEVHVPELKRLFNAIDPSPFRERDLDPKAEEFIVGWAKDLPTDAQLALLVHLDRPAGLPEEGVELRQAVHEYFHQRAEVTRRRLRELFRRGRTSLLIGIVFLAALLGLGDLVAKHLRSGIAEFVRESLLIGGWVAMWKPIEVFLYDWWPIRNEARIYDRLAAMPVQIRYMSDSPSEAWRSDWPATNPAKPAVQGDPGGVPDRHPS